MLLFSRHYLGGIFDHIGYGFSRYSTDRKWLVPHFEKMLYDNALLLSAYAEAYSITQNELYESVCEKTVTYLKREMMDEKGGFYSAQDADSEGVEGKYYVFTPDEIINILGQDDGKYFNLHFNITPRGNFEGKNIPNLIINQDTANNVKIEELAAKVLKYRKQRATLHKDDKILTAWNALLIVGFTKAYKAFVKEEYLELAKQTFQFIETYFIKENKLYLGYRNEHVFGDGIIDDYAFTIWALIELYEATLEEQYIKRAINLLNTTLLEFFDDKNGGFYHYGKSSEALVIRPKETYDGAIPSGNSVMTYNLNRLSLLTGDNKLREISELQLKFMFSYAKENPAGTCFYHLSLLYALSPSKQVVCVPKDQEDKNLFLKIIRQDLLSNTVYLLKNEEVSPFTKEDTLLNGETTFYICENNACMAPFNDFERLKLEIQ